MGFSQYYISGTDPASIKWRKIETDNFRIVFPDDYSIQAQQIAGVLTKVYSLEAKTMGQEPKKIDVLIHAHTAYSNGFVSWAPKRIELYPIPDQTMYSQDWLEQLAIHEYRHVVQISQLNKGFTKALTYIFGEQAIGAVLGLYVPLWLLEGDAVSTETAFSYAGRGRMPWFEQEMRAQILEKGIYSYDQAYFETYNHYTPNYYNLGFLLVAGGRARYGASLWSDVLHGVAKQSFSITPFNRWLKKRTSYNKDGFYYSILDSIKKEWIKQDKGIVFSDFDPITKRNSSFENLKYPVLSNDSISIVESSGPAELKSLKEVYPDGSFHKLITTGTRSKEPISYANNILVWSELEPDIRWDNRMFSNIIVLNVKSGKSRHLTHKGRYFSPAVRFDGKEVAAVNVDKNYNSELCFLSVSDGTLKKSTSPDSICHIFTPRWSSDGTKIVCVILKNNKKQIAVYEIATDKWKYVTNPDYTEISLPNWKGNNEIIYTGSYSGKEEIYCLDLRNKEITQLTTSKFGANGAFYRAKDNSIVYSYYTSDGYQLVSANIDSLNPKALSLVSDNSVDLASAISAQEGGVPDFSGIKDSTAFEEKKYSKWNLFNFHSWAPAFININDELVYPGVSAMSQNLLGTTVTSLGYNADPQMSDEKYYFSFDYTGLYPVFNLELKAGNENFSADEWQGTTYYYADTKITKAQASLGSYIPFNFKRNKFYRFFKPSLYFNYHYQGDYSYSATSYGDGSQMGSNGKTQLVSISSQTYSGLEGSLYFYNLLPTTDRDATYRWGQIFDALYEFCPVGDIDRGSILGLYSRFYFPGLMKHHSIRIGADYQKKSKGDVYSTSGSYVTCYSFGNYFNYARGYNTYSNDELLSFRGDYIFPLINPDLSIHGVMYLKRITSNLFFDYSRSKNNYTLTSDGSNYSVVNDYKSCGVELRCETHLLRFLYPFTIGGRYSRLIDFNQNKFDLILGINISGFNVSGLRGVGH